jgi:ketosteroid isomerase-like protein
MSEENIELLGRAVEAFNQHDMEALVELTSTDFEFMPYLATLIETTTYLGHEGLDKYFADAESAWEEIHVRLDDVRDAGHGLIYSSGELYGRGRASGLEVRVPLAWVSEISDGKLTRLQSYQSAAEALEAAGLRSM